jgi:glucokinase
LAALVGAFLSRTGQAIEGAVLAVAGPVIDGRVTATISNLPWDVDQNQLQCALGLTELLLLNDLEAAAWGVPQLGPHDYQTLNAGRPGPHGAIAIVAPGTGLGEAFLLWDGNQYQPYTSDGGQASFAPSTAVEADLWRYLYDQHGRVSCEMVCSGIGIPNIYTFLRDSGRADEPVWLKEKLLRAADPTPVIVKSALASTASICSQTLQLFISILGGEAGNMAIRLMTTGGVYLTGGIPPRILLLLQHEKQAFLHAFSSKGLMTEVLVEVPVRVIIDPQIVRKGAAIRFRQVLVSPN